MKNENTKKKSDKGKKVRKRKRKTKKKKKPKKKKKKKTLHLGAVLDRLLEQRFNMKIMSFTNILSLLEATA